MLDKMDKSAPKVGFKLKVFLEQLLKEVIESQIYFTILILFL